MFTGESVHYILPAETAGNDYRNIVADAADLTKYFVTAQVGHSQIQNDKCYIPCVPPEQIDRLEAIFSREDCKSKMLKHISPNSKYCVFIIGEQNDSLSSPYLFSNPLVGMEDFRIICTVYRKKNLNSGPFPRFTVDFYSPFMTPNYPQD